MATLSAVSCDFSRHLFKDGERLLILSNCLTCGEARIGSSYDDSIQQWEASHACMSRSYRSGKSGNHMPVSFSASH
jgi:hypothetical protein